jgi:hypothetical protein
VTGVHHYTIHCASLGRVDYIALSLSLLFAIVRLSRHCNHQPDIYHLPIFPSHGHDHKSSFTMADILGTITAALTLVEVIVKTSAVTARLCKDLQDIPEELTKLLLRVNSIGLYMPMLERLEKCSVSMSQEAIHAREFITDRFNCLASDIESKCEKYKARNGVRRRISITKNKAWIEKCLNEIEFLQGHLTLYILMT